MLFYVFFIVFLLTKQTNRMMRIEKKECGQDPSSPGLEKDRKILAKYFLESNQRRSFGERIVIIPHNNTQFNNLRECKSSLEV